MIEAVLQPGWKPFPLSLVFSSGRDLLFLEIDFSVAGYMPVSRILRRFFMKEIYSVAAQYIKYFWLAGLLREQKIVQSLWSVHCNDLRLVSVDQLYAQTTSGMLIPKT